MEIPVQCAPFPTLCHHPYLSKHILELALPKAQQKLDLLVRQHTRSNHIWRIESMNLDKVACGATWFILRGGMMR